MRGKQSLFMFLLLLAAVPDCVSVAGSPIAAHPDRIETEIRRLMDERDVPSYSVAIVHDDDVIYSRSFGVLRRETEEPATPDSLYNIGSVTKTFTASLLMILRDRGLVDLDDPLTDFLPVRFRKRKGKNDGKTAPSLRQLARHRSGLPRTAPNSSKNGYTQQQLIRGLNRTKLVTVPGEKWSYSNFGYDLLGHALEIAADESYEALLREHIFEPLEMRDSSVLLTEEDRRRFAGHYWAEDRSRAERPPWVWTEVAGSGGITSSLEDMTKYVAFLLDPSSVEGKTLSPGSLHEMLGDPIPVHESGKITQCIGWIAFNTADRGLWYAHGGEVDGHSSYVAFSPPQRLGIVVLANLGGQTADELGGWLQRELHDWN